MTPAYKQIPPNEEDLEGIQMNTGHRRVRQACSQLAKIIVSITKRLNMIGC